MYARARLTLLALAVGVVLLQPAPSVGQTTSQDLNRKVNEAVAAIKSYAAERKNDAVAYGQKLLSEFDQKYKGLEKKAARATGEAKTELEKELKALKAKRKQAARKLDELGKASGQSWDRMKRDFADAYRELQELYERVVASLKT